MLINLNTFENVQIKLRHTKTTFIYYSNTFNNKLKVIFNNI